jgi:NDP-sugar pyrophosphorylase family protein
MKVVILAAGAGKRLQPLSRYVAKPLLPVKGKPVVEEVIDRFRALSPEEIIVVIGSKGEQVREYLGHCSGYGAPISYVTQAKPEGTARALQLAMDMVRGDFVVSACDSLVPEEHLRELWSFHLAERCAATLSLKVLDKEEITSSSSVKLEADSSISRIIEKPSQEEILSSIASSPLYVFSEAVKEYLPKVKKSRRGEYELQDAIQRMIDDGLRVKGIISEEWIHLSNIEDFLSLNFEYVKRWLPRGY